MATKFVDVSETKMNQFKENAVPQKKKGKRCYKIWNKAIQRKVDKISLLLITQFTENWHVCLHFFCFKVSATFSNFCEIFCSTEWIQQQQEFTNEMLEIENM